LLYRQNGAIQLNEYRPLMKNLDELPMPAYDLFPMDKYQGWSTLNHYQEIFTSRGCPFGCSFCIDWVTMDPRGNRDWQRYRIKSASRVVDELELLSEKYGVKCVHIFDLNFNPKRSRVEEFLKEMQKRKPDVKYCFLGNAHSFVRDRDLLGDLHATGFISGVFGLEVADEDQLKKLNKGITVDEVREVTAIFRKIGICSVITWMIGFPDDDEAIIKRRFQALDEIDPDVSSLQMLLPVPGMPAYDEWKQYIEVHDLKKWDFHQPVVRTKHLTREQLGELAVWANMQFYTRKNRVQRVLESPVLHPFSKAIFQSYM
jgi:anaerobic magnesium-protoporphyrin IX monomethyl ester cyclase